MFFSFLRRVWPSTYLAGVITLLSVVLPLPENGRILDLGSPCGLFNVTGIPCPGCGLTRSFVCLGHGLVSESLAWHPLGPLLWTLFAGYFVWSAWMTVRRPPFPISPRVQGVAIGSLAATLAIFWALRLAGVFPMPESPSRVAAKQITGTETDNPGAR